MSERPRTRSELHGKKRKKGKKKAKSLKIFIILLLFLIVSGGALAGKFYMDARRVADTIYEEKPEEQIVLREEPVNIGEEDKESLEPFSVLLLGVDSGALGREDEGGRSDALMVATVNPNTNSMTVTSIPRDTYTEIVGYGVSDKINHAYSFGGTAMAVNTVQNLLNIPIDYTVSINMGALEEVINAIGGVDLVSTLTFSNQGYDFVEGQEVHLNGSMALAYVQDRFNEDGDYGRQERQRQLISAIVKSAIGLDTLTNYQSILRTLEGNFQTDLTFDQMLILFQNYRNSLTNLETYQLQGYSEVIEGIYYEMIDEGSLIEIQTMLANELEL